MGGGGGGGEVGCPIDSTLFNFTSQLGVAGLNINRYFPTVYYYK